MPREFVNWTQEKNIAIVVIDNPPVNALSLKVAAELLDCLKEINAVESCRAIVITGAGEKAFCAGASIKELAELVSDPASSLPYTEKLHITMNYLQGVSVPTIAAINGYALGGGLETALACDLRIASEKASLGLPEIKLGLFPGAGGTQRLPRLIGITFAKEMLFTGLPLTASEGLKIGLVNKVVPHGEVLDAAKELAHLMASRPGAALKLLKEAVDRGIKGSLEEGCRLERDLLERVFNTEDAKEGIDAFLEKRDPKFTHR